MARVQEKPKVQTASPPVREGKGKYVIPFLVALVVVAVIVGVAVLLTLSGSDDNVSTPASAVQQPAAAPVAAPVAPVASAPVAPIAAEQKPAANVASPITAGFTPGFYTLEQVERFSLTECQRDAANVVACFLAASYRGDSKRLRALVDPIRLEDTHIAAMKERWRDLTSDGSTLAGFEITYIYGTTGKPEPLDQGLLPSGPYQVRISVLANPPNAWWARESTDLLDVFRDPGGKWSYGIPKASE